MNGFRPGRWRPLLLASCLSLLVGCGDSALERDLLAYQQRLAEALDQPPPEPAPVANIGDFPERRQLTLEIPPIREGMLDVFALRGCHIANLVAERNNQLGKTAAPSQRWLYELRLWRRLSACWNAEAADALAEGDRQRLARLTDIKTRQLPLASYNALVSSEEWTGSFSRASSPLPLDELSAVDEQLAALGYLNEAVIHQFDRQWTPESGPLEQALATLRDRPLSAELMRALMLASQRLEEASRLLERALASRHGPDNDRTGADAACSQATTLPEEGDTLASLERLETQALRWFAGMDRLLDAHVAGSQAFKDYRRQWLDLDSETTPLASFVRVRDDHLWLRQQWHQRCDTHEDLR
ncbi:DUF3080 domain-containing protein [Halomonas sp. YLB-10]|uniref:DUF3080 domain-containing protein n=1 Tax=Halomonas sp. YLB-10 TaxID=2483111 RepID=UPI0021AB90E1|nr:DUF3080 domain-containing protein [Halomonas sp. YLB-10]